MRGKWLLLILSITFLAACVYAQCNSTQIDINSANAAEMDKIIHVGTTVAGYIIDARPFSSLDDLSKVDWLGSRTSYITDIKQQGLACVASGTVNTSDSGSSAKTNSSEQLPLQVTDNSSVYPQVSSPVVSGPPPMEPPSVSDMIYLNPSESPQNGNSKVINSDSNPLTSGSLPVYGLIGFTVLLGCLFLIRKVKGTRKYKTEFDEQNEEG